MRGGEDARETDNSGQFNSQTLLSAYSTGPSVMVGAGERGAGREWAARELGPPLGGWFWIWHRHGWRVGSAGEGESGAVCFCASREGKRARLAGGLRRCRRFGQEIRNSRSCRANRFVPVRLSAI